MPNQSTICWNCSKACRGCSWSRNFQPVDGWQATPTKVYQANGKTLDSFIVHNCPQFEKDTIGSITPIKPDILAIKLGISRRALYRMQPEELVQKCKELGIELQLGTKKAQRFLIKKKCSHAKPYVPAEILKLFWHTTKDSYF